MKRDMELVRTILLLVNNHDEPTLPSIEFDGYPKKEVDYHVDLLVKAEYLEGINCFPLGTPNNQWIKVSLSWKGHEFIDDAQDEELWAQVNQAVAEKGGNVSLAIISGLILSFTKQSFGLP